MRFWIMINLLMFKVDVFVFSLEGKIFDCILRCGVGEIFNLLVILSLYLK